MSNFKFDKVGQVVHQGDVFIRRVSDSLLQHSGKEIKPSQERPGRLVVQHGEAVGHFHTIPAKEGIKLSLLSLKDGVQKMLLTVEKEIQLTHEEHGAITFTPGTFEISTQREQRNGLTRAVLD